MERQRLLKQINDITCEKETSEKKLLEEIEKLKMEIKALKIKIDQLSKENEELKMNANGKDK